MTLATCKQLSFLRKQKFETFRNSLTEAWLNFICNKMALIMLRFVIRYVSKTVCARMAALI